MEFSDLIRSRYSVRAYKPDPVPDEHVGPGVGGGAAGADRSQSPTVPADRDPHGRSSGRIATALPSRVVRPCAAGDRHLRACRARRGCAATGSTTRSSTRPSSWITWCWPRPMQGWAHVGSPRSIRPPLARSLACRWASSRWRSRPSAIPPMRRASKSASRWPSSCGMSDGEGVMRARWRSSSSTSISALLGAAVVAMLLTACGGAPTPVVTLAPPTSAPILATSTATVAPVAVASATQTGKSDTATAAIRDAAAIPVADGATGHRDEHASAGAAGHPHADILAHGQPSTARRSDCRGDRLRESLRRRQDRSRAPRAAAPARSRSASGIRAWTNAARP